MCEWITWGTETRQGSELRHWRDAGTIRWLEQWCGNSINLYVRGHNIYPSSRWFCIFKPWLIVRDYDCCLDFVSSIHRFGLFSTIVTWPRVLGSLPWSPSAKRLLFDRTGHGSMVDADTVNTVAKNVKAKSDETNVRFWWFDKRILVDTRILWLEEC